MDYAYIRVSTKDQCIDRQLDAIADMNLPKAQIFIDKESGKNFDRTNYKRLIRRLKKGDCVTFHSLDRMGRDYEMIQEEWRRITHTIGADIRILDMPLLDTTRTSLEGDQLMGQFIGDLVLQVLAYVAQREREVSHQRQAEGIAAAKARGVRFGRPVKTLPSDADEIFRRYSQRIYTGAEACTRLGVSKGTFYRYCRERHIRCL